MATRHFEHRSTMATTLEQVVAFHADSRALSRLSMPPTRIQVLHDDRESLTSGRIAFRLWLGPVPVRWVAEHMPGPTPSSFTDVMVEGPLARWEHQHIFQQVGDGVVLIDRIAFEHKSGLRGMLTRLVFDGLPLRILFMYRHWRTRKAVEAHAN